jgi:hypothetical protein
MQKLGEGQGKDNSYSTSLSLLSIQAVNNLRNILYNKVSVKPNHLFFSHNLTPTCSIIYSFSYECLVLTPQTILKETLRGFSQSQANSEKVSNTFNYDMAFISVSFLIHQSCSHFTP